MDKSALTFPYQYKQIDFGKLINPLINIPVKTTWGWQPLWFLVDSGADTTMLTVSIARNLGMNFDIQKKTKLYGIGEKHVFAYPGKVSLKLEQDEIEVRCYFIDATETTLLLGRLDIFDKYSLLFDAGNQTLTFSTKNLK